MTGLDNILKSITDDAKKKADKIILEAKNEEKKILESSRLKANERFFEIVNNAESQAREIMKRAKSQAELERKNILLEKKYNLISDTILSTKNYILNLDDKNYFNLILLICEKYALPYKGEIIFSDEDFKRIPRGFKTAVSKIAKEKGGDLKISEKTRNISGGVILSYGEIEENCSIDALINENHDDLEDRLNLLFFEE